MNIWEILGIAPTKDEALIKHAYLSQLPKHHPEEDPEGFRRLREAMEQAITEARNRHCQQESITSAGQMMGSGEIQLLLKAADELYRDFGRRIRPQQWQALLDLPVCQDLETQKEASMALLGFLMDHHYIPHSCWQILDQTFGWEEDADDLCRHFPEDYIQYVASHIRTEDSLRYELFPIREDFDYDEFCRTFFNMRRSLSNGDKDAVDEALAALLAMDMEHPDLIIEQIFHEGKQQGHEQQAWELAKSLLPMDPDYEVSRFCYARAALDYEKSDASPDELENLIRFLLEQGPEQSSYWLLLGDYLRRRGDLSPALNAYQKAQNFVDGKWEHLDNKIKQTAYELSVQIEQNPETDDWWNLAYLCWRARRYDRAKELLEAHTPSDEQKMTWLFLMGGSCHELKQYPEAIRYRREIWDLTEPENRALALYLDLAEDYEQNKQPQQALELYQQAQEHFSGNQELCYRHAALLFRTDQSEEALRLCDSALESGFHRDAFLLRLDVLLELERYEQVREDAGHILERGFNNAQVLYDLARALRQLEEYEQAEQILKELIDRTNSANIVCREYAYLCSDTKRPEEALAWIEKALAQGGAPTLLYRKADYLHELKRYEEELAVYDELCRLGADNDYIYYCIGHTHKSLQHFEEAEQYFRRSLERRADYGAAWDALGDVLQEQGKWEDAALAYENGWNHGNHQAIRDLCRLMNRTQQYDRAEHFLKLGLERYPDDTSLLWIRSTVLMELKQHEEVIRVLNRYMELKPSQSSSAYRRLGLMWARAKNYEQAEACYQKAIDLDPDSSQNWRAFGKYWANYRNQQETALLYQEKAVRLEPSCTYGWLKLGEIYEALGRSEDAMRCYETSLKNYQAKLEEDPYDCCECEGMADALIHLNRLDEAEEMLRRAFSLQNHVFTCDHMVCIEGLEDLAKAAERRGDLALALEYMQQAGQYSTTDHYPNEIERLTKAIKEASADH